MNRAKRKYMKLLKDYFPYGRACRKKFLVSVADDIENFVRIGGLEVDESESDVTVDGRKVRLTPIEHRILLFLVRNAGTTYSSTELYENIWGEIPVDTKNIVAVHIRHIREKIEIDPKNPRYVKVVWGRGYKIQSQTEN